MRKKMLALLLTVATLLTMVPTASAQRAGSAPEYCTLTIGYYIKDTETKIAPTYKASLPAGSRYDVESPTVVGYKVADDGQQTISGTLNENATVQVYYTTENATASYTINYIGRGIDGKDERQLSTVVDKAPIGEYITAEDKTFSGYVRDPGTLSLLVTADNNAVLNVFYTETVNPCIVFSTGGDYVEPIVAEAGTDISGETGDRGSASPAKPGYTMSIR